MHNIQELDWHNTCSSDHKNDRDFASGIENSLPPGSAIYQLPYTPFPETPPLYGLRDYQPLKGYLHSRQLYWSFGGMRWRTDDIFYRELAKRPLADQSMVIRRLGFAGIYLDRRGFADGGKAIEHEIQAQLGDDPQLINANGHQAFYRLPGDVPPIDPHSSETEIMAQAGFYVDRTAGTSRLLIE